MEVLVLLLLFLPWSDCQEKESDLYNVGPYKHIYPPTNISNDEFSCSPNPALNETCPLYVALLMSFGGSYVSSGVIPGIQVALDQINSDPRMLPGYTLHYTLMDSQVRNRAFALQHQFSSPYSGVQIVPNFHLPPQLQKQLAHWA